MSMGVIQSADATSCVGSGRSLEAASGAMTTTTSHITLDTRLTARSGAAERELRTGGRRPGDEGHRDLGGRLACDKARTERGWRGQLRERNEDFPALWRSFLQPVIAGSIPVTRSHRDG